MPISRKTPFLTRDFFWGRIFLAKTPPGFLWGDLFWEIYSGEMFSMANSRRKIVMSNRNYNRIRFSKDVSHKAITKRLGEGWEITWGVFENRRAKIYYHPGRDKRYNLWASQLAGRHIWGPTTILLMEEIS